MINKILSIFRNVFSVSEKIETPIKEYLTILFADINVIEDAEYEDDIIEAAINQSMPKLFSIVNNNGGKIINSNGNEMMVSFHSTTCAVKAVVQMQEAVSKNEIDGSPAFLVSAGIDCGPLIIQQEDVFGNAVKGAARLINAAKPGQLLATKQIKKEAGESWQKRFQKIPFVNANGEVGVVPIYQILWMPEHLKR